MIFWYRVVRNIFVNLLLHKLHRRAVCSMENVQKFRSLHFEFKFNDAFGVQTKTLHASFSNCLLVNQQMIIIISH